MLWPFLFFLGLAVFVTLVGLRGGDTISLRAHALGGAFEVAAAGLGVWLTLIIIWWARQRGKFDPFELPVWISVNVYVQVVLNVWLLQRDWLPSTPWLRYGYQSKMVLAVLLFGVSLTALWAGYVWAYRQLDRSPHWIEPSAGPIRMGAVIAIWFLGWTISSLAVVATIQGYLGAAPSRILAWMNYLNLVDFISIAAGSALVIYHFRRPTLLGWLWLAVMLGSNLVSALIAGSKSFALSLLWLAIYIYYAKGKLPTRWLAVGLIVVIVVVPIVNVYRANLQAIDTGRGVALSARLQALGEALQEVREKPTSSLVEDTRYTFERRQGNMLDVTASTISLHPSVIRFIGLDMAEYFLRQLIPRVLWPNKPTDRPSFLLITTTYSGAHTEYSFSEIGLFADSYRAGGWPFVVIWFMALGAFSAWLYRQGPGSGNMAGTVFYIAMLTGVLRYEREVTTLLLRLIQFGPLIWIITMFVMFVPLRHRKYQELPLLQ